MNNKKYKMLPTLSDMERSMNRGNPYNTHVLKEGVYDPNIRYKVDEIKRNPFYRPFYNEGLRAKRPIVDEMISREKLRMPNLITLSDEDYMGFLRGLEEDKNIEENQRARQRLNKIIGVGSGVAKVARALSPLQRLLELYNLFANPMEVQAPTIEKPKPRPEMFIEPDAIQRDKLYNSYLNSRNRQV